MKYFQKLLSRLTFLGVKLIRKIKFFFQIVFEGVAGNGTRSYIALDDLISGPGCIPYSQELPLLPTTNTSPTTTPNPCGNDYKCETTPYSCIKQSQV